MRKSWSLSHLITIIIISVLFVLVNTAGSAISIATGVIGLSTFWSFLFIGLFSSFSGLALRRFGAISLMTLFYGFLIIPTAVAGPPGFVAKLLFVIPAGLVADLVYSTTRTKERTSTVLTGAIATLIQGLLGLLVFTRLVSPEGQTIVGLEGGLIYIFGGILIMEGCIGGFLGWVIFNRLKMHPLLRRFRGE